jgi:hypothetical protein
MKALWALVASSFESAWQAEALLATAPSRRAAAARVGVPYLRGEEAAAAEERWGVGDPQRRAAA